MSLSLGSSLASKVYLGATEIKGAYLGATQVYSSFVSLLDLYPATAAYSAYDLGNKRGSVTESEGTVVNPVQRWRRGSDDALQMFTAEDIDDGTALDFVVPTDVQALYNSARYFNGTSTYVDCGANLITAYPFELTATIATTVSSGVMGVASTAATGSAAKYGIEIINGFPALRCQSTTAGGIPITGGTSVADGANHTIRAVFTGNTSREFFVDGVSVGTDVTNIAFEGGNRVNVGRQLDSSPANYFSGVITSVDLNGVAAYTGLGTSVTAWEDTIGSNDGTETNGAAFTGQGYDAYLLTEYDQSGNDYDLTQTTAANQPLVVSGGALVEQGSSPVSYFDGIDDNLSIPAASFVTPTTALQCSVVVRNDQASIGAGLQETVVGQYDLSNNRSWAMGLDSNSKVQLAFGDPANGSFEGVRISDSAVTINEMQVVGFEYDAGTVTIYRNGIALASTTSGAVPSSLFNSSADFRIGCISNVGFLTNLWNGQVGTIYLSDNLDSDIVDVQQKIMTQYGIS